MAVLPCADDIEPWLQPWRPANREGASPFVGRCGEVMFWDPEEGSGFVSLLAPTASEKAGGDTKTGDEAPKMKRYRFCALSLATSNDSVPDLSDLSVADKEEDERAVLALYQKE